MAHAQTCCLRCETMFKKCNIKWVIQRFFGNAKHFTLETMGIKKRSS